VRGARQAAALCAAAARSDLKEGYAVDPVLVLDTQQRLVLSSEAVMVDARSITWLDSRPGVDKELLGVPLTNRQASGLADAELGMLGCKPVRAIVTEALHPEVTPSFALEAVPSEWAARLTSLLRSDEFSEFLHRFLVRSGVAVGPSPAVITAFKSLTSLSELEVIMVRHLPIRLYWASRDVTRLAGRSGTDFLSGNVIYACDCDGEVPLPTLLHGIAARLQQRLNSVCERIPLKVLHGRLVEMLRPEHPRQFADSERCGDTHTPIKELKRKLSDSLTFERDRAGRPVKTLARVEKKDVHGVSECGARSMMAQVLFDDGAPASIACPSPTDAAEMAWSSDPADVEAD